MIKIRSIVVAALLSVLPLGAGVAKTAFADTESGLDAVPVRAPELPALIEFEAELIQSRPAIVIPMTVTGSAPKAGRKTVQAPAPTKVRVTELEQGGPGSVVRFN